MLRTLRRGTTRGIALLGLLALGLAVPAARAADEAAAPGRLKSLDVSGMDTEAQPCTDFYRYADGKWLDANPIPADRPRWGPFDELNQRNRLDLRDILEKLAAEKSAAEGSDEKKLGDFYASCMDEPAIEAAGLTPIRSELAKIDAIRDAAGLRAEIARLQSLGANVAFNFGSEEDRKDASRVDAAAIQGGLGLPDRDYYLKNDAKSVDLRKKYAAHVAKTLELAGSAPGKAAADAKAILQFETRLARASQDNVEIRDPDKTYHPTSVQALAAANRNLDWPAYFAAQSVSPDVPVNVWEPDYFRALDGMVTSVPLATWKSYLRWQLLSASAPTLPKKFVEENFAFYGKTLSGTPEMPPRWKRCVNAVDNGMGMALGRIYVRSTFHPKRRSGRTSWCAISSPRSTTI